MVGPGTPRAPSWTTECENNFPADSELVQDLLLQLDTDKSMEPHQIPPRVLRELADAVTRPLSIIFQGFGESGEISVNWKLSNLVPFLNKGKKEDLGSYRPVSLTSLPGKIMEIILGVVEKHLKDNAVVGQSQHGFSRGKSCLMNLIAFYDRVTHLAD